MNLLKFDYVNHRDEPHTYVVRPGKLSFGPCGCFIGEPDREAWYLECEVVKRDDEPRPGTRKFAIIKMRNVAEL